MLQARGVGNQFDLVVEQYNTAKREQEEAACRAMVEGELLSNISMCSR